MSRSKLPPLKERVAEVTDNSTGEDTLAKPRKKKKTDNGTIEAVLRGLFNFKTAPLG